MLKLRFLTTIVACFLFTLILNLQLKLDFVFAQDKTKVKIITKKEAFISGIDEINISSDGKQVFLLGNIPDEPGYKLTIINLFSGKINQMNIKFDGSVNEILLFCSTLDSQYLIIGANETNISPPGYFPLAYLSDAIYVYDIQKFRKQKVKIKLVDFEFGSEAVCLNNKKILLRQGHTIMLLDLLTGKEVWSFEIKYDYDGYGMDFISFSPDGKYLITHNQLWDINKAEVKFTLPKKEYFVGFSPDSKYAIIMKKEEQEESQQKDDKTKATLLFLNTLTLKIDRQFDNIEPIDFKGRAHFIIHSSDKRNIFYRTTISDNTWAKLDTANGEYMTFEIKTEDSEDSFNILSGICNQYVFVGRYSNWDSEFGIVDTTNGEVIVTIIPYNLKKDGWVAFTNTGYYDSSSYFIEEKFLKVAEGGKVYNITLYRDKLRKPEIVKSVFVDVYRQCNKQKGR
jgi:hypothetical protein